MVVDLVCYIIVDNFIKVMLVGIVFYDVLEYVVLGDYDVLQVMDYMFYLLVCELVLLMICEVCVYGEYGGLIVIGKVDCLDGKCVDDYKIISRFDVEWYLVGYQWWFYLDLFGVDVFCWNVFELKEVGELEYCVLLLQLLEVFCYLGLYDDCMYLVLDYLVFVQEYLLFGYCVGVVV